MMQINIKDYFEQQKEKLREKSKHTGIIPQLAIIDATNGDVGNRIYMKRKVEDFESMGWQAKIFQAKDTQELNDLIDWCNMSNKHPGLPLVCSSVMVQLPVRDTIDFDPNRISPKLDCDGLCAEAKVNPATVCGVLHYLQDCGFDYQGKNVVVLGRSKIVGKPMADQLLARNSTVTICHSYTTPFDFYAIIEGADLIVSAVGKPNLFSRNDISDECIVIDVGINRDENGKLCGDFVEDDTYRHTGWSTPVPGGVGLLTRLGVMENCYELAWHLPKCIPFRD